MKITVIYGETQIHISGKKSLKKMKKAVEDIVSFLPPQVHHLETEESNPIGFTVGATLERAPVPEFVWEEDEWEDKSVG